MYLFLQFLVIVLSFEIIAHNSFKRLIIYIVGISFIPYGVEILPHLNATRFLTYSCFISIFLRKKDRTTLFSNRFFVLMSLLLISHLLIGVFDDRVGVFKGIYKGLNTFAETFGCLLIGYVMSYHNSDVKKLNSMIYKMSIPICLYSILSFLIGTDIYCNMIGGSDSLSDSRMRVAGFFYNSHIGGFALSIYLLIMIYRDYIKGVKPYFNPIVILLFVTLLLTKSRSSLLDFGVSTIVLYLMIFWGTSKRLGTLFLYGGIVFLLLYISSDVLLSQFTDAFKEDGGKTGGSTTALRLQQLVYSLDLFFQAPWFGNGLQYFWEVIIAEGGYLSSMLMGAESYVFVLLIERGVIQIILVILFFFYVSSFFIRHMCTYSNIGLAIIVAFLINSVVTGNLYKWPFALTFIGFYIRQIVLSNDYVFSRNTSI